jgi:hypothetical protein
MNALGRQLLAGFQPPDEAKTCIYQRPCLLVLLGLE